MNVFISVLDTQMLTGNLCVLFASNVTCRMVLSYGLILVKFKNKTTFYQQIVGHQCSLRI